MPQTLETDTKLDIIRDAVDERKAEGIEVLDLRDRTLIADYFVVANGTSNTHIKAIADSVIKKMREHKIHADRVEGYAEAKWVLVDYGDVVVHVFAQEEREFYDLEALWRATAEKLAHD
jgi:ribosome-associated protein